MPTVVALRELFEKSLAEGVDKQLVRDASDELTVLCGQVFRLQRAADPRKAQTVDLARRVHKADEALKRNGTTTGRIPLLAQQFDRCVSRIHALLAMSREPQDG